MRRTSITLPDDVEDRLRREARRRGASIAEVVREAIAAYLPTPPERRLSFTAVGESGEDDLSERVDEIVAEEIARRHP